MNVFEELRILVDEIFDGSIENEKEEKVFFMPRCENPKIMVII